MIDLLKDIKDEMASHNIPFFVDLDERDILICDIDVGKFAAVQVREGSISLVAYSPAIKDFKAFITTPVVPGMQMPELAKDFVGEVIAFMAICEM